MKVVTLALNPGEGICFSAYDTESETYYGPPGKGIHLTHALEEQLNFTSRYIYASSKGSPVTVRHQDPKSNTSWVNTVWTGMAGLLISGRADWSPCSLYQTLARYRVIDFSSTPYGIGELVMVAHIPDHGSRAVNGKVAYRYDSILLPFSSRVWEFLFGSIFIYGLLVGGILSLAQQRRALSWQLVSKRARPRGARQGHKFFIYVLRQWLDLLKPLLCLDYDPALANTRRTKSFSFKLVISCYLMAALILSIEYSGELKSFLSTNDTRDWIVSWSDLFHRILEGFVVCYIYGSGFLYADAELYFGRPVSSRLEFCRQSKKQCLDILLADPYEITVWIEMSLDAVLLMKGAGIHGLEGRPAPGKIFDRHAELYVMGSGLGRGLSVAGIVFSRRHREVFKQFQPWIERFAELGFFRCWEERAQREVTAWRLAESRARESLVGGKSSAVEIFESESSNTEDLHVEDLAGTFVAYAVFCLIAFVTLVIEKLSKTLSKTVRYLVSPILIPFLVGLWMVKKFLSLMGVVKCEEDFFTSRKLPHKKRREKRSDSYRTHPMSQTVGNDNKSLDFFNQVIQSKKNAVKIRATKKF